LQLPRYVADTGCPVAAAAAAVAAVAVAAAWVAAAAAAGAASSVAVAESLVAVAVAGQQPVHLAIARPFVILHYWFEAVLIHPLPSVPPHGPCRVRRP